MGFASGPLHNGLTARGHRPMTIQSSAIDSTRGMVMVPVGAENTAGAEVAKQPAAPYRTPRIALIVVLPENHVVSAERIVERLRAHGDQQVDVVVACAGQPTNLASLHQSVGHAQFLLAPAGTTMEDLRELAMRQVQGDIVTLVSGAPLTESAADSELFMTS